MYFVVRHFAGESSMYYGFYDEVGGSPQGVVRMLFTDPGTVLGALVETHDIVYLICLACCSCSCSCLARPCPRRVAAAPGERASGLPVDDGPRYHSVAAIVLFLIAATVFAVSRIRLERRVLAAFGGPRRLRVARPRRLDRGRVRLG